MHTTRNIRSDRRAHTLKTANKCNLHMKHYPSVYIRPDTSWNFLCCPHKFSHFFTLAGALVAWPAWWIADQHTKSARPGEDPASQSFFPSKEFKILTAAALSLELPSTSCSCARSSSSSTCVTVMMSSSQDGVSRRDRYRATLASPWIVVCFVGSTTRWGPCATVERNANIIHHHQGKWFRSIHVI